MTPILMLAGTNIILHKKHHWKLISNRQYNYPCVCHEGIWGSRGRVPLILTFILYTSEPQKYGEYHALSSSIKKNCALRYTPVWNLHLVT